MMPDHLVHTVAAQRNAMPFQEIHVKESNHKIRTNAVTSIQFIEVSPSISPPAQAKAPVRLS